MTRIGRRKRMVTTVNGRRTLWRGGKSFRLCALLLFGFVRVAGGQQAPVSTPQFEMSGAYSYIRANPGNSIGGFNQNGGSGSFTYNVTDRFAVVADFGGYRFRGLPVGMDSTMYTYLFGPRVSVRKFGRTKPFAHVLLGGGRLNASSGGLDAGENAFAMAVGGGLDVALQSRFTIRAMQAEYLLTRFARVTGVSTTQNDIRISSGLVFRFGRR